MGRGKSTGGSETSWVAPRMGLGFQTGVTGLTSESTAMA